MLMNKKSQIGTVDLFVAVSIASLLLIIILSTYYYYNDVLEEKVLYNDMQMTAFAAVDYLVKSPGQPVDWELNPSNATRIGLASRPLVLSQNKTITFTKTNNQTIKEALNIVGYDFYFSLKSQDGTTIASGKPPSAKSYVVNAQRIVTYRNYSAKVDFKVWK